MNDDKVILKLSRKDVARLADLMDGLAFMRKETAETKGCLNVTARILLLKEYFNSIEFLKDWCWRMENIAFKAKYDPLSDSVEQKHT